VATIAEVGQNSNPLAQSGPVWLSLAQFRRRKGKSLVSILGSCKRCYCTKGSEEEGQRSCPSIAISRHGTCPIRPWARVDLGAVTSSFFLLLLLTAKEFYSQSYLDIKVNPPGGAYFDGAAACSA